MSFAYDSRTVLMDVELQMDVTDPRGSLPVPGVEPVAGGGAAAEAMVPAGVARA